MCTFCHLILCRVDFISQKEIRVIIAIYMLLICIYLTDSTGAEKVKKRSLCCPSCL